MEQQMVAATSRIENSPGKKKILLICGSLNQTTSMHQISRELNKDYDCWFSPYYSDGLLGWIRRTGWFDFLFNRSIVGGTFRENTLRYLRENRLAVDDGGMSHDYDLVVTCTDQIIQKNLNGKKVILVQEGMTDPLGVHGRLVKWLGLPRWLGGTGLTGQSKKYDIFCTASEGYRQFFEKEGVPSDRMVVTGIPNYDHCRGYLKNEFPHHGYALIATSDARETLKFDHRKRFLKRCKEIAGGRQVIVKFHPNERFDRAIAEVKEVIPDALVYTDGRTEEMIANCSVLMTQYSTVAYVGLALGKEVHSFFDVDRLGRLLPMQNGGDSARRISILVRRLIEGKWEPKAPLPWQGEERPRSCLTNF